ncbi:NAD(P)-binding protein [Aspergillus cavernicola]|uniref:NAD(P)-binding protein n=1 Tax=Aspergillus cavernicola TaxID=176166 RepID=A0ABR4J2X2_9EURO
MPGATLPNATALITGGGSGINFAFARVLHERGCNVLIADLRLRPDSKAIIDTINAATSANGPRIVFHQTDVTNWTDLENAFDRVETEFGTTADVVCAGAGIYEPPALGFWADVDTDSHYKILDVNLLHPIKTTRIAVRRLQRAQKPGHILHIASVAAQTASLVTPLYQASKHGVVSFVRGMEGLQGLCGIRVVCVAPGSVATPLLMEEPQIQSWFDKGKDILLDPAVLAKAMLALVEDVDDKYPAGTILEVTENEEEMWRRVPLYDNPGPQGRAISVSNKDDGVKQIREILFKDAGGVV